MEVQVVTAGQVRTVSARFPIISFWLRDGVGEEPAEEQMFSRGLQCALTRFLICYLARLWNPTRLQVFRYPPCRDFSGHLHQ